MAPPIPTRTFLRTRSIRLLVITGVGANAQAAFGQDAIDFDGRAFAQFVAVSFEETGGGLHFDTERLRFEGQMTTERLIGVMQVDLAVPDPGDSRPGTLANGILDLAVDYKASERYTLRFGQFKTPLGMDFDRSGDELDITNRGPEVALTLRRDFGVLLSGQVGARGLAFDVGLFNVPGRSEAVMVSDDQQGEDHAVVGRLRFDREHWHAEVAHGVADNAGGPGTQTYDVTDIGLSYEASRWLFRAEAIAGDHVRGEPDRNERTYYLHGSYSIRPRIALVGRHYESRSEIAAQATELTNTYLGATAELHDQARLNLRLQVNYVIAGGDKNAYSGLRGFRDDALIVQFQVLTDTLR